MTAKIFEFKPKLATPTHTLYLVVQEAANGANALKITAQVLSARESLDAVTCVTPAADEQKRRAQDIASVKYEAQLAEQKARNVGETLTYRRSDFPSDLSFLMRQLHALDAEIIAIDAQLICAALIADAAEREGLDRPVGECDFLKAKAERKQVELSALEEKIVALSAAASGFAAITVDQPSA